MLHCEREKDSDARLNFALTVSLGLHLSTPKLQLNHGTTSLCTVKKKT